MTNKSRNEHLDNAWEEFVRTGAICNYAEQLLCLADTLTQQNKSLLSVLTYIVNEAKDYQERTGGVVSWLEDATKVMKENE